MAEPRRPASRGGPKGRPPSGPPPAINHFPFPSARGRTGAGSGPPDDYDEKERRRSWFGCSMVLAYGQVFTLEASEARAPHTPQITSTVHPCSRLLLQSTEAAHCPQCEGHARARALLVLNPAGSTSSARSGFGLLGGRCLDPAHASTERCKHGQQQRACVPRRGKVPPHPLRRPKQRFDGESALCSEDHVRLISHKLAATRLDLPGLASTLGMRRLSSPRPRSLMLHR